jgi:hypothetical protein
VQASWAVVVRAVPALSSLHRVLFVLDMYDDLVVVRAAPAPPSLYRVLFSSNKNDCFAHPYLARADDWREDKDWRRAGLEVHLCRQSVAAKGPLPSLADAAALQGRQGSSVRAEPAAR